MGFHQFGYLEHHYDGLAHTHGEYSIVMCTSGALEVLRAVAGTSCRKARF